MAADDGGGGQRQHSTAHVNTDLLRWRLQLGYRSVRSAETTGSEPCLHPPIHPHAHPPTHPPTHQSPIHPTIRSCIYSSIHACIYISMHPCIYICIHVSTLHNDSIAAAWQQHRTHGNIARMATSHGSKPPIGRHLGMLGGAVFDERRPNIRLEP